MGAMAVRDEQGRFMPGIPPNNRYAVGTIRIRTRYKRGGKQRAFIKISEPNTWKEYARYLWEQYYGPIPRGMGIHHKDEDSLHDTIENFELVSKKEHLALHRASFEAKRIASSTATRRIRRWSTQSTTKRVGRHPKACRCHLHGQ